jgi:hypothetical protein
LKLQIRDSRFSRIYWELIFPCARKLIVKSAQFISYAKSRSLSTTPNCAEHHLARLSGRFAPAMPADAGVYIIPQPFNTSCTSCSVARSNSARVSFVLPSTAQTCGSKSA